MSTIGSLGGSLSTYIQQLQQLQQQLLSSANSADSNGSVTQSAFEQAITGAGSSTASANTLFAELDPDNTGSVDAQQAAQGQPLAFSSAMGAEFIADQAQNSGGAAAVDPTQMADALFSQITGGSSTMTQAQIEQAVTNAGGTTAEADALYAKLDPNNTGSVSEQQFADALDGTTGTNGVQGMHHGHGHHHSDALDASQNSSNGNSASDALEALMQSTAADEASGTDGSSGATASTSTDATSGNSAQAALNDLLAADLSDTTSGTAGNAMATGTDFNGIGSNGLGSSLPASPFGNLSPQMLSYLVQLQSQGLAA